MRAIRPDEATRRRTHKPETISWQCIAVRKKTQLDAGDSAGTECNGARTHKPSAIRWQWTDSRVIKHNSTLEPETAGGKRKEADRMVSLFLIFQDGKELLT